MSYQIDAVVRGVYDYYNGVSLNKIRNFIDHHWGLKPTDSLIYRWIKRITRIGLTETSKYIPQVGDKWLAYETAIKLKDGDKYWLINVIDYDTHFLLASKLSDNRKSGDITATLVTAKKRAGGVIPNVVLTYDSVAYAMGIEQAFGSDMKHIEITPFKKDTHSIKIEDQWHRTFKGRLKPMRGMDKSETYQLLLEGFILHYNFLQPNESLNSRTPAEVARLKYPYRNWIELMKNILPKAQKQPQGKLILDGIG